MEHIGIDLGSKESQICVRSASEEILLERGCGTDRLGAFLSERSPGRVIGETCTEAFRVAAAAQRAAMRCVSSRSRWCGRWASASAG
jgi:hypothetical protein